MEHKKANFKTYTNIKLHLRKEHNDLWQVGALITQQSKLHTNVNITKTSGRLSEPILSDVTNDLHNTILDTIVTVNGIDTTMEN